MTIKEIKDSLSIEAVLSHYGLVCDRNWMLSCPFHTDKTPSLQIYPKTNSYCCFSTNCNAGTGDQLQLMELMEVKLDRVVGDRKAVKHHCLELAKGLLGYRPESLVSIFSRLRMSLRRSKKAQAYAASRCIDIEKCEVGYNRGSYEELKNCLVFPLKDKSGQVVSLYGRSILNGSTHRHFYQRGRRGLYPGYPDLGTKVLVLTEGVIDAWSLEAYGELSSGWSVLALYGSKVLSEEQELAIEGLSGLEEIVLFFDGDLAGAKGVEKWQVYLSDLFSGIKISKVSVLEGEDINSLVQSHEGSILSALLKERKVLTEKSKTVPLAKSQTSGHLDTSNPNLLSYEYGQLLFSLIGGINGANLERLRVTLKVERRGMSSRFRHSFDLYNDDHLGRYIRKASDRLDVSIGELGRAVSSLIDAVESYRLNSLNVLQGGTKVELSEARRRKAEEYLRLPYLLKRTNTDIGRTGVVGERINRLLMYLCFTSRKRDTPLHVITLGGSGSGKTYLQERISELMPEEDVLQCTASTDNAFYYIKNGDLRHMLVLIEDLDGAESVLYIIRELMSKKWVSKLVPIKDASGKMETVRLPVYGPICLAATTTRESLYEDNANRSLLIYPDGSKSHQESIMNEQRRLSAGLVDKKGQEYLREFFKDIQRVLRPIEVRNPYAEQLRIPESCFKPLRTHAHYLHFIEAVTYYHQYQRQVKHCELTGSSYIETTLEDIEASNALLKEVLLAKSDELVSRASREFYERLKEWLEESGKTQFTGVEVRRGLRMAPRTVNRHLGLLKLYGYVLVSGGNRYRGGLKYELGEGESYADLRSGVGDVLDNLLEGLRQSLGKKE